MSKNVKIVIIMAAVIALMLGSISWVFFDPHPWWQVWLIVVVSFVCFQAIAYWCASAKLIFQLIDYIYYLVIGGLVGVGSQYVLNGAAVKRFDSLFELQSLTQELASVQRDIPSLTKSIEQMGLQPANDEFLASCLLQNLQNRLKTQIQVPNSRRDGSPVISPDPCRSYLERQAQVAALKQNLDRLLTRQNEIPGQIETLRKALVPSSTPSTALPPFKQLTLQFLYIPTVALMGICVKLGATTCSLRS